MTHADNLSFQHKDLKKSQIARDEQDVEILAQLVSVTWINPFQENNDLIHLATEVIAAADIKDDLLSTKHKGEQAYKLFLQERLDSNIKGLHDSLPKLKLKIFTNTLYKENQESDCMQPIKRSC